jgi:hypothetical protein
MISALLLGLVAIATFTGLQAVNSSNANSRFHTEAEMLAEQSQEHLRTDPITALEKLAAESVSYSTAVDGTRYTVTQSAKQLNSSGVSSTCTVTERVSHAAPNYEAISAVTWHGVQGGVPVTESSVVTPAVGSSIEVDIENAPTPTAGVSGVTVDVKYTSPESGSTVRLDGTTGAAGCIVFTGIRATSATIEVQERQNFVTTGGALTVPPAEVSIAPNLTTPWAVAYDEGGAIKARFTYEGKPEHDGQKVTGDTFVVSNEENTAGTKFEVGSTSFVEPFESGGEEHYAVETGDYQPEALTAKGARYALGDLFPFPSAWHAYAGDCEQNEPLLATGQVASPGKGVVSPGGTREVEVPMSYVTLKLYEGTLRKHTLLTSAKAYAVKITNTSCSQANPAAPTPDNATGVAYAHLQKTTSSAVLEDPFQPFGKAELCLQDGTRAEKAGYDNSTVAGSTVSVYLGEETEQEKTKARGKEEETAKAKRLEEEAPAKTARVNEEAKQKKAAEEEATTKAAREKVEAAEKTLKEEEPTIKSQRESGESSHRTQWAKEESERRITKATREKDEKEQTSSREAAEAKEKATKVNRENEEKADSETKRSEEAAKTTRAKEEASTKEKREKEEATAKTHEKEETEKRTAREKEEKEEVAELANAGLKLESGTTC